MGNNTRRRELTLPRPALPTVAHQLPHRTVCVPDGSKKATLWWHVSLAALLYVLFMTLGTQQHRIGAFLGVHLRANTFQPVAGGVARYSLPTNAEEVNNAMQDPEAVKEMQAAAAAMMRDPEQKEEIELWHKAWLAAVARMKSDPSMQGFVNDFTESAEKGLSLDVLEKYKKDPVVMKRIQEMQAEVSYIMDDLRIENEAERELFEELVREVFDKFDQDKDGILNLHEFNALQSVTEGDGSQYDSNQLQSFVSAVDPDTTCHGMPFNVFAKLYLDARFVETYGTDILKDHGTVFNSDVAPGSIPSKGVPDKLFKD